MVIARKSNPKLDRQVLLNGKAIGRVLFHNTGPTGTHHWTWTTVTTASGRGDSLDACLQDLKSAVTKLVRDDGWLPTNRPVDVYLGNVKPD